MKKILIFFLIESLCVFLSFYPFYKMISNEDFNLYYLFSENTCLMILFIDLNITMLHSSFVLKVYF